MHIEMVLLFVFYVTYTFVYILSPRKAVMVHFDTFLLKHLFFFISIQPSSIFLIHLEID